MRYFYQVHICYEKGKKQYEADVWALLRNGTKATLATRIFLSPVAARLWAYREYMRQRQGVQNQTLACVRG